MFQIHGFLQHEYNSVSFRIHLRECQGLPAGHLDYVTWSEVQKLWKSLDSWSCWATKIVLKWDFSILLRYVIIFTFCALMQNVKLLHNIEAYSFLTELFTIEGVYPRIVLHFQQVCLWSCTYPSFTTFHAQRSWKLTSQKEEQCFEKRILCIAGYF